MRSAIEWNHLHVARIHHVTHLARVQRKKYRQIRTVVVAGIVMSIHGLYSLICLMTQGFLSIDHFLH